jgi:hypothetical protein
VDNDLGGEKELLRSLIRTVMEYDPMFVFQILTLKERGIGSTSIVVTWLVCGIDQSLRSHHLDSFLGDMPLGAVKM